MSRWQPADFDGTYGTTVPNHVPLDEDIILNPSRMQPAPHVLQTGDHELIVNRYFTLVERMLDSGAGINDFERASNLARTIRR